MPLDLSNTLVIGVSSTALFDLSLENKEFEKAYRDDSESAVKAYRKFTRDNESTDLKEGTAYPLVKALLNLNSHTPVGEAPLVEVVVLSRNSPETGLRVLNTIKNLALPISRSAFTAGEYVTDYLEAYGVDLFLTTNEEDAQRVIDSETCAAAIVYPPPPQAIRLCEDQVRIAFDGDAVIFDDSSEVRYKEHGIEAFHEYEDNATNIPLPEGPHASLLKKIGALQERLPMTVETSPVRIALVTARNAPSDRRTILTLREWGVYVDQAFFLGGLQKQSVLEKLGPHIFFDDQPIHLDSSSKVVSAARVPYKSTSPLFIGPKLPGNQ